MKSAAGKYVQVLVLGLMVAGASACGEDPSNVSDQIGIKLSLKEGDVTGSTVETRKNISTETSNPYAAFLEAVKAEYGDQTPSEIRVEKVVLQLVDAKDDVAVLEDLFNGKVEVFLAPDDAAVGYIVGTIDSPTGSGPHDMERATEAGDLVNFLDTMLAGSFRVGIRGSTPRSANDKFTGELTATLSFAAYE